MPSAMIFSQTQVSQLLRQAILELQAVADL